MFRETQDFFAKVIFIPSVCLDFKNELCSNFTWDCADIHMCVCAYIPEIGW